MELDVSEVRAFARDLAGVEGRVPGEVRKVVSKGALNIKDQMRREMGRSESFAGVVNSISYDLKGNAFYSEAEIGPVTEGKVAGDLAHIAYFGGAKGGGGTVPDPVGALDAESPKFESALADLIGKLL